MNKSEEAWAQLEAILDAGSKDQAKETVRLALNAAVRMNRKYVISMAMNFILLILLWM